MPPLFLFTIIQSPNATFSVAVDKTYHIAYPIVNFAVGYNVRISKKKNTNLEDKYNELTSTVNEILKKLN